MDAEDILAKLRELKPLLAEQYKAKEISLFGSFVHGEQDPSSDIDILIEFDSEADLFDWIGLALYLEEIFQRPVDVIPKQALRAELRETVLPHVLVV
jgi:predicted nucleotidyltransferase